MVVENQVQTKHFISRANPKKKKRKIFCKSNRDFEYLSGQK